MLSPGSPKGLHGQRGLDIDNLSKPCLYTLEKQTESSMHIRDEEEFCATTLEIFHVFYNNIILYNNY